MYGWGFFAEARSIGQRAEGKGLEVGGKAQGWNNGMVEGWNNDK